MVTKYSFGGGLLDNNVYANNKKKKEEMDFMQGLLTDPAYQRAKTNNQNTMSAINNPAPDNVMQRANAYTPEMDIEYPAEVLAEPQQRNMLEEYLFGSLGFQPSVEQKKTVYRATKNLTDMEKLFFQNNPDKFFEYFNKVGDFAPTQDDPSGSNKLSTLMQNNEYIEGLRKNRENAKKVLDSITDKTSPAYQEALSNFESAEASYNTAMNLGSASKYDVGVQSKLAFGKASSTAMGTDGVSLPYVVDGNGNKTFDVNAQMQPYQLTTMERKYDDKMTDPMIDFNKQYSGDITNIDKFGDLINVLESGENVSGWVQGLIPDALRPIFSPQAEDSLNEIQSIVYQSLRATLGAQFTEREGRNLVNASWNKSLSEEVNLRRLKRLYAEATRRFEGNIDRLNYFKKYGTLALYDGAKNIEIEYNDTVKENLINGMFSIEDYKGLDGSQLDAIYKNASEDEKYFMDTRLKKKKG